jgi:hypothetical protein
MAGTAELTEKYDTLIDAIQRDAERRRAMLLSWVDEAERDAGYGQNGRPPRTAQIRQFWRDSGEPILR